MPTILAYICTPTCTSWPCVGSCADRDIVCVFVHQSFSSSPFLPSLLPSSLPSVRSTSCASWKALGLRSCLPSEGTGQICTGMEVCVCVHVYVCVCTYTYAYCATLTCTISLLLPLGPSSDVLTLLPGSMRGKTMLTRSSASFTLTCSARQ